MARFIIDGRNRLEGKINVAANKNAVLPIMAATLLCEGVSIIHNVPEIKDVEVMVGILRKLGAKVALSERTLTVDSSNITSLEIPSDLAQRLRASVLLLGPLLARAGEVRLPHPGGDVIGRRGIFTHISALTKLGAQITQDDLMYYGKVIQKKAVKVFLDEPSVTGTENVMMYAALTDGETTIENAAAEPHVVDLSRFLASAGITIEGAGTSRIRIIGKKSLKGGEYTISPDPIEAGTFAIASAVTKGDLEIGPIVQDDMQMIKIVLERFGVNLKFNKDKLRVNSKGITAPLRPVQAMVWPGFPTDLMSPLIVLATQAEGQTLCHDPLYESRMFFVDKLIRMGAHITVCDPHRVIVYGRSNLYGRELASPDIRAGMALVLAALIAEGKSVIDQAEIVERGYENIDKRLRIIGADIKRSND